MDSDGVWNVARVLSVVSDDEVSGRIAQVVSFKVVMLGGW